MTIRSLIPPMTVGTIGADNHLGGLAYYGLAGNDTVTGGGAQSLGSGNDFFSLAGTTATYGMAWGADGADTLVGADADPEYGGAIWVNILYGGSGADSLVGGTGGDRLFGDCMDMALAFCRMVAIPHEPGADTLSGGGGGDVLVGGEGADRLTGGAGADLFVWETAAELTTVDTITDFDAASDLLLFNHLIVPTGATPNLGAYLSLVPSGGNTLLQLDRDGSGGAYAKQTVATLTGSVTALDASRVIGFNAEPIFLPQVGAVVASEWSDTVVRPFDLASGGDATQYLPLYLLGGNDDVTVEYGGSWYHLGDGNDTLTYRPGFLNGFPGDPAETFGMAALNVDGGHGNDTLTGGPGADRFNGGSGADVLTGNNGDDRLFGDCGDTDLAFCVMGDFVEPASGADTISGGDGQDVIHGGGGADLLTGGAGSDLFIWEHVTDFGDTITDFETGPDGDRLFFTELIIPQGANAVVSQYVKLQQSGGDTLVYLDRDGTGSAHSDQLVVTLKGVAVSSFSNGQLPGLLGSGLQPLEISSTAGGVPEHVVGTYWADAIDLNGDAGYSPWNHHLLGGDDTVTSGLGGNYVLGDGNDRFIAKPGTEDDLMVSGDAGNDTLVGGDGADELTGGSGADSLVGGAGADYLFGDCNDQLLAFCFDGDAEMAGVSFVGGVDTIDGGAGADMIHGGEGADDLTGGADSDLFVYESATEFDDTIRDFAPGAGGDKILLNGVITSTAGANVSSYVFLQQSGSDTLVRFSASGSGASGGTVVATLKNVSASTIDLQNQILLGEELRVQSPPPDNTAPVGANATISATEDQAKSGNLPAATDADGDPITYAKVGNPSHGTLTIATNGAYTYTPTANYNGTDSFRFSVSDGKATVEYTANVTVTAVDDAPTGTLTIAGTPTQGQTLTLTDAIADADGLGARTYAWLANGAPITSATGTTLVLDAAQVGKTISVRASYTDGGGKAETVTSSPTAAVASSNGGGVGTVLFSTLVDGQHLAFDPSSDVVRFDSTAISAASVRIAQVGDNLSLTAAGKTVWLDATTSGELTPTNVTFADASVMVYGDRTTNLWRDWYGQPYTDLAAGTTAQQVQGAGGADSVQTGSSNDWIVGNGPVDALEHVSRNGATGGNAISIASSISADGRYVVFDSDSTNLAGTIAEILVKDLQTGTFSVESGGSTGANPTISADGHWVVFQGGWGLLPDAPGSSIFIGSTSANPLDPVLEAVSTTQAGAYPSDGGAKNPDVSADGRYVVFTSWSRWNAEDNTYQDIYLKDRVTGELTRISTSLTGTDGNNDSDFAKVSADGRYVVFQSFASNLVAGDTNGYPDIFVWDRNTGQLTSPTIGTAIRVENNVCYNPDIAFDSGVGGVLVFESPRAFLEADTNNSSDIYAYSLTNRTFQLVSSTAAGTAVNGASEDPAISGDGRFVVFRGYSDLLVPGDTNGQSDIFVKDLMDGRIARVSVTDAGVQGNVQSRNPAISLGGDWITFESSATNLATTDANGTVDDIYRVSNPLLRDTLAGGAGDDTYVIERLADIVTEQASAGTDLVRTALAYTLGANLENLTLTGANPVPGTGNTLDNVITGNDAPNLLSGLAGNDTLSGGAGDDTLTGGDGNDLLEGGPGIDSVVGGAGDDRYVVDSLSDVLVEAAGGGADTILSPVAWTLAAEFEHLTLTGTADVTGTGNAVANRIEGNGGANLLSGLAGNDTLLGHAGNDTLDGGTGDDLLEGGAGDDGYLVDSAGDVVVEAAGGGTDTVRAPIAWTLAAELEHLMLTGAASVAGTGNTGANRIEGNTGANLLSGLAGNDTLLGGDGADTLDGGAGTDRLEGGADDDVLLVDSATDVPVETAGGGVDTVQSPIAWTLGVELEHLMLTGTGGVSGTGNGLANRIEGNGGANLLSGLAGADTLLGGDGADTLLGGAGADRLTGGGGDDLFRFTAKTESTVSDTDVITDFASGDRIEFGGIAGIAALPGVYPWAGSAAATVTSILGATNPTNTLYFFTDGTDGYVHVRGAGTGTDFDGTLVRIAGRATAPTVVGFASPEPAVHTIAAANATQAEGNSGVSYFTFTISRSGNLSEASQLDWLMTSGTANAEDFYLTEIPFGSVGFVAGETTKTITVEVAGDTAVEPDETFTITLTNPFGGIVGAASSATGTIQNDDSAVTPGTTVNGTAANDAALTGGAGNDTINGFGGADTLTGAGGDDLLDGGSGMTTERDLAVYTGPIAGYTLSRSGPTLTIADATPGRDGTDTTTNLERLQFSDMAVNLTVQATAASIPQGDLDRICELYLGFFARVPAADGLENWVNQFKNGKSLNTIADDFYGIGSSEALRSVTGYWDFANKRALSEHDFVRIAYRNVLGREGLEGGINYWAGQLGGSQPLTRGELVGTMLDAAKGLTGDATWGWVAELLDDKVVMSKRVAVDWGLNYGANAQQAIEKGVAIANSATIEPNPAFPASPIKTFDFDAATELIGVNPANLDLIA